MRDDVIFTLILLTVFLAGFFAGFNIRAAMGEEITMEASITTVSPKDAITVDDDGRCWIDRVEVDCDSHEVLTPIGE